MSISDMQKMISGYDRIAEELEICRKYGIDYYTQRGKWTQAVEKYHPRRLELRVSEKFAENADTTTLRLVSTNGYSICLLRLTAFVPADPIVFLHHRPKLLFMT